MGERGEKPGSSEWLEAMRTRYGLNLIFTVARYEVGLSFREVFKIEFCDASQLAAGSFIQMRLAELAGAQPVEIACSCGSVRLGQYSSRCGVSECVPW